MKRFTVLCAASILVAACGGDEDGNGGDEPAVDTTASDSGEDAGGTKADAGSGGAADIGADVDVGCTKASDCPAVANPCLRPTCDLGFGCKLDVLPDATACDDGDKCTTGESCANGTCTATGSAACDDKNACTTDACNPSDGKCLHNAKLDGAACDDGDPCNGTKDSCKTGGDGKSSCEGGANLCQCDKDADCVKHEDNDPCNGTLVCVKSGGIGTCKIDKNTIIICPTTGETDCMKQTCDAGTAKCKLGPVKGVVGCNDGDVCTVGDTCQAGKCVGTNACQCKQNADCNKLDDGNPCTGIHICSANKCVIDKKTVPACSGKKLGQCAVEGCIKATGKCGKVDMLDGNPCDDGNACWSGETCQKGVCTKGKTKNCACEKDADCPDDGNLCNGKPGCDKKSNKCVVDLSSAVSCTDKDGNVCTEPGCDPKTGTCSEKDVGNGLPCSDGDACTSGESCQGGACGKPKKTVDCNDMDACTSDSCDAKKGVCAHTNIPGCNAPAPIPQEASTIFNWLVKKTYKSYYKGESMVHGGSIHAPVRGWFSPALFKSLAAGNKSHPVGAAAVKELYQGDKKTLKGWAVNIKVDKDTAGGKGWYSYEVFSTTNGANPAVDGKGVPLCVGCHKGGKDFILSKWPLL